MQDIPALNGRPSISGIGAALLLDERGRSLTSEPHRPST
jgi:hypothetical protein